MRFIADNTVGKLRRWMNLLGYDVVYDPRSAREILRAPDRPRDSETVVLGRCPGLAETPPPLPSRFFHLESPVLEEQLKQVARAHPLDFRKTLFSRCSHCNLELQGPLKLEDLPPELRQAVPERVREWREDYFHCPKCRRVYWEGTHTAHIREELRLMLKQLF